MNLSFDVIIAAVAIFGYIKKRSVLVQWIFFAFCLFAVSYVLVILGIGSQEILIPLRAAGYLSVIAGLVLQHWRFRQS